MSYRRKPVAVEAFQWNNQPHAQWPTWLKMLITPADMILVATSQLLYVPGGRGRDRFARLGDWLVLEQGRIRHLTPERFARDYEATA